MAVISAPTRTEPEAVSEISHFEINNIVEVVISTVCAICIQSQSLLSFSHEIPEKPDALHMSQFGRAKHLSPS